MKTRLMLLVGVLFFAAGCSPLRVSGTHTWPMTQAELAALRKTDRTTREAWFANLELPRYEARRRNGTINVDAVLAEEAWNKARLITLRGGALGGEVQYETRVRMLWDDEAIYLAFECDDPDVHNPLTKHDGPLWKHDLVELFIDVNGNGSDYMELHVAPGGATADAIWGDFRKTTDWFTDPLWKRFEGGTAHKAWSPKGITSAVKVNGTLNKPDDTDRGYLVEWRIPYSAMANLVPDPQKEREKIDITLFKQAPVEKPRLGTVWRMNFNRCDDSIKVKVENKKGDLVDKAEYSAWAPTTGSFHMPFLFGHVVFVE